MENKLTPWIVSQLREGHPTRTIYQNYLADPFSGDIVQKTFFNRVAEIRATVKAVDTYRVPSEKETQILEQEERGNELEVRLRSFQIQTEWDLRRELGYEDEEAYPCIRFKCRPVQNEKNPYFIVEGHFEKAKTFPVLQQVQIPLPKLPSVETGLSKAAVVFNDQHIPFHDPRCFDIGIQILRDVQPSHVFINGDFMDFTDLSRWPADIEHRNRIQDSLIIGANFISQIKQASPFSKVVYLEGNHEDRLRKEILKSVAAAANLKRVDDLEGYDALSVPNLLCLKDAGVKWVPYKDRGYWLTKELKWYHGEELSVSKMAKERNYSMIVAHGHRMELVATANEHREGQSESYTQMFGCMCKVDGSVPASKTMMNWQQGVGVVYYNEEHSNPVPVFIHEGRALFNGREYEATIHL